MKILTASFNYGNGDSYTKLGKVLEYSVKKNCPDAEFTWLKLPAPKRKKENHTFDSNNYKIKFWLDFVEKANDDVILLDTDMIVLHDLSVAFTKDFDIGLSCRGSGRLAKGHHGANLPWNGGAVFVSNTEPARQFMRDWVAADNLLYAEGIHGASPLHQKWRAQFGGMNQASLGYLLAQKKHKAIVKPFDCLKWNSCIEHWDLVNASTMIIHVKEPLRRAVLSGDRSKNVKAFDIWQSLSRECGLNINVSEVPGISIFKYTSYEQYLNAQKTAAVEKRENVWVKQPHISFLVRSLKKRITPKFGLCHGTRKGLEQLYFMELFPGCKVIGTEIADYAKEIPNTVQHDFNKVNDEWTGKADFVYSNAFDHAYQPEQTLKVWLSQLSKKGILIIEHTRCHAKEPSITDPFSFTHDQLTALVSEWTRNKYRVSSIITSPPGDLKKNPNITRFILIERSLSGDETLEAERAKAMGRSN